MIRDDLTFGALRVTVETSPRVAAESLGEYVTDAIAADFAISDDEMYQAARVGARWAAQVIRERWPMFGHDWR